MTRSRGEGPPPPRPPPPSAAGRQAPHRPEPLGRAPAHPRAGPGADGPGNRTNEDRDKAELGWSRGKGYRGAAPTTEGPTSHKPRRRRVRERGWEITGGRRGGKVGCAGKGVKPEARGGRRGEMRHTRDGKAGRKGGSAGKVGGRAGREVSGEAGGVGEGRVGGLVAVGGGGIEVRRWVGRCDEIILSLALGKEGYTILHIKLRRVTSLLKRKGDKDYTYTPITMG
ncbi:hypothetical protein Tco_0400502 [Tanacetum coccineum]